MKVLKYLRTIPFVLMLATLGGFANAQTYSPSSAGDFGNSHPSYPASRAIDGNTAFSSRWAATFTGGSANLFVDLGTVRRVDNIGVAWGRGDSRTYRFEVRARVGTSGRWTRIFRGNSSGRTSAIENYNVDDIDARQVRVKVFSESGGGNWANVTEFEVYGTSGPSQGDTVTGDPSPTDPPTNNRFNVPGVVQAEDFNSFRDTDTANRGGAFRNTEVDIQSCSDSGCGFNVGWTRQGEWLQYNLDVSSSGTYEARVRVASNVSGSQLSFNVDGQKVSNNHSVGNTGGWQRWTTQTVQLGNINQGDRTLRLNIENSGLNINWINIVRTGSTTTGPIEDTRPPNDNTNSDFGLNPSLDPWDNFDLSRWALDTPAPRNDDRCRAERTWDYQWDDRNPLDSSSAPFFFTHTDGGMRFVTRIDGQTTNNSCNSGFVRSELREMIRQGNRDIEDTGVTRNNWKLGYQPGNDSNWGGVNGRLDGTLRVNKVTTTGSSGQVGRVIIGQIHAGNDEPLRLYYRKRNGQSRGCIYFSHEIRNSDDVDFNMLGDEDCTSGPSNGIELNELFSYSIINDDEDIQVIIRRGDSNGSIIANRTIDMNSLRSGYDRSDEWMYFKLGAYTQNDSGDDDDGDIVTFYRFNVSHD